MGEKEFAAFLSGVSVALTFGWIVGIAYPVGASYPIIGVALVSLILSYVFDKRSADP